MEAVRLKPFFTYYGAKYRAATHYPTPDCDAIVEPFAGAAGYSVRHHERQVTLRDVDPVIVGTWRYLIGADPEDIYALPDVEPGQSVDDLEGLPVEARWLIGWWLNHGTSQPAKRPSSWMRQGKHTTSFWGPAIRERLATQVGEIRHWTVERGTYETSPEVEATWFIDPPYQAAGRHYKFGAKGIDYIDLADWCKARQGQVIVCEADGADWLPFRPFARIKATVGRQKASNYSQEVIWP